MTITVAVSSTEEPASTCEGCIQRCCPLDQWYDETQRSCQIATTVSVAMPAVFSADTREQVKSTLQVNERHPCPGNSYMLNSSENLLLLDNGHLLDGDVVLKKFCFTPTFPNGSLAWFVCFDPDVLQESMPAFIPIALLLSSLFLVATFAVYASIRRLRNIHGKCLMSYTAALFVAYVSLSATHLQTEPIDDTHCFLAGN